MSNTCAGGASASGGEHRIMNNEVLMGSEKELENLFNGLMQRAFRGELVG